MTLPTVSIRHVSHNQLYRCIRVLYDVHHEVCTTPSHQARQAAEFRRMKDGLDGADVLLHFDFSDNFSCSHQESIQSVYWCQSQVSIFTGGSLPQRRRSRDARTDLTDHTKTTIVVYLEYLCSPWQQHPSVE